MSSAIPVGENEPELLAVSKFREYLRIRTVHPQPDYEGAHVFLRAYAKELGLSCSEFEITCGRQALVMTWSGTNPELPSLLLNSHTDVVPVYEDEWKYDPFAAVKLTNGDIYARGTQDMKSVGIQYLEAIRHLKASNKQPLRSIHLLFMPDEEIGGHNGMAHLVNMEEFEKLRIGFALDEGLANPRDEFTVYYGERAPWWVHVTCTGNPGHGSRFIENTAAEKLRRMINSLLAYREEQRKILDADSCLVLGDVTTVNMTMLSGGVQPNVVPSSLTATFDIRVSPHVKHAEFDAKLSAWAKEAGDGISFEWIHKFDDQTMTSTKEDNPWWTAFSSTCERLGMKMKLELFSGATDSRFLRKAGYPALGFSPMNNTPILLHDHNEFINEAVFLRGIDIYAELIAALANLPAQSA